MLNGSHEFDLEDGLATNSNGEKQCRLAQAMTRPINVIFPEMVKETLPVRVSNLLRMPLFSGKNALSSGEILILKRKVKSFTPVQ